MKINRPGPSGSVAFVLVVLGFFCVPGCRKDDGPPPTQTTSTQTTSDTVADIDGNIYATTLIGSQRWMAENLRTLHYSNGASIQYVPGATEWAVWPTGGWSAYSNDTAYDTLYGKLYNWYAVIDVRNVCPTGWHVPTDGDWMELEETLGVPVPDLGNIGLRGVSANSGGKMKALNYWNSPNTGANDSTGFSAFAGGYRQSSGAFTNLGLTGTWWSSSEFDPNSAMQRQLWATNGGIYRASSGKKTGSSVRCVED